MMQESPELTLAGHWFVCENGPVTVMLLMVSAAVPTLVKAIA
jgi:hypothetical protein